MVREKEKQKKKKPKEKELEEVDDEPGPHQRQIFESLESEEKRGNRTMVLSVSRMPRSFSVTMFRRIQKQGYMNVMRKKMG